MAFLLRVGPVWDSTQTTRGDPPYNLPVSETPSDSRGSWRALALAGAGFGLVAALFASWTVGRSGIDDVYITYVYARSFAQGHGLTWPGSTALGTSSPFLAVVLGSLSFLTGFEVPDLGNALSWITIAVASTGLFALGRAEGWPWAGFAAGVFWLIGLPSHVLLGNEFLPAIAAVIWAFHERARGRLVSAGVLLALAAMFRAETGLAAPILACLELRRGDLAGSLRRIARIAGAAMLVAGIWLAALYALTGTVLPATFAAKRAQAESTLGLWSSTAGWKAAWNEPWKVFPRDRRSWWWPLAIAAAVAVGSRWLGRNRGGQPPNAVPASALALLAWGAGHLSLVVAIGVPFYPWYAAPLRFAQQFLPTLAWVALGSTQRRLRQGWMIAAGAALATVAFATRSDLDWLKTKMGDLRRPAYSRVAELAELYPAGTRIAAWEVGFLGWESDRQVVDLLGLVSDGASLDAVRKGDLRSNLASLRGDLLMTTLGSRALWAATVGEPRRFLADYRLDQLTLSPEPPLAVYRRAALAPRGEAQIDLLATVAEGDPAAELVWHNADKIGLLSLAIARGEEVAIRLPPGPRRNLTAQLAAATKRSRVRIVIATETGANGSIEAIDAEKWRRYLSVVPESKTGATITFSCLRGNGCRIGQPYLGEAYETAAQPRARRERRPRGKPGNSGGRWRP